MKILIIAPGSRGDVQPYLALGRGLHGAGQRVSVLAASEFAGLVAETGLDFVDMGSSAQKYAQTMQRYLQNGNMVQILANMGRAARLMTVAASERGLVAGRSADLLLGGLGGMFVGEALAEKLGVPFFHAHLLPLTPTRAFPSVLTPLPASPLTAWANPVTHRLAQQMLWQNFRAADTLARREVLGLKPAPWWGPFGGLTGRARPVAYGYSAHVLPPPPDWPATIHVTGYWLLEPPAGWAPPDSLVRFLEAGPPPVYLGFGSMVSRDPAGTARLALAALARAGLRGVLSAGWGGLQPADVPETVFLAGGLPHTWLFPRMAAVVHHGGAGTTAAGLWSGVPSVVTPFFGDQPFWARRVHALGVGPRPIPFNRLTVDGLAEALHLAATDAGLRQRAADLGQRVRAEDGIGRAVRLVEAAG